MHIKGFMTRKLGTIQRSESELDTLYVNVKEVLCQLRKENWAFQEFKKEINAHHGVHSNKENLQAHNGVHEGKLQAHNAVHEGKLGTFWGS